MYYRTVVNVNSTDKVFFANKGYNLDWTMVLEPKVHEKQKLGRTCLSENMVCSTKKHTGM